MKVSILIVDDEKTFLESVEIMLALEGFEDVTTISKPLEVVELLKTKSFDVAFLDITMPDMSGMELLRIIKEQSPPTECIMVTANETISNIVKATRMGAYDYLVKPILPEQLKIALDQAIEHRFLLEYLRSRSIIAVREALDNPEAFSEIITGNEKMFTLLHEAELQAASNIPVLVDGETGVGKELLARAIHDVSERKSGPFIAVNMLALSPSLFESEFFGHAKGAFTGADREKEGYLSQASKGTLFLDEIGDLSLELQGKLLRILQEGEFVPVGKTNPQKADVRFIAATNQNLEWLVQNHKFRKDLYYRLLFARLNVPPLRDRENDIPMLAAYFAESAKKGGVLISEKAIEILKRYDWPGNIRELKGVIESAANLAEKGIIEPDHLRLPESVLKTKTTAPKGGSEIFIPLADVEKRHILEVFNALGKNKSKTARTLGIGLQTLYRKLKEYDVS